MNITIKTIPQSEMRNPSQLGDLFYDADGLQIRAVEGEDATLIVFHELCEAILCKRAGVSQLAVDVFDESSAKYCDEHDMENGDLPTAPYRLQHRQSMLIEHLMAS